MQDTDVLDQHWRNEGLSRPLHRALTFTQEGLVLGRGTLLADFAQDDRGKGRRGPAISSSMATKRASFPF